MLRSTPFPLTHEQIVSILVEVGGNEVTTKALAVLKDKQDNSTARINAAKVLSHFKEEAFIADLLTVVKDKQDDLSVRRQIVPLISDLKGQAVISTLQALLEDKKDDSSIRRQIALFASNVKPKFGWQAVLKDKQDNAEIRGQAASALGWSGEQAAIPDLLAVLKDKQDNADVRRKVAWVLVDLGESKAVQYLLSLITGSYHFSVKERNTLEGLIQDYATIRACAKLLRKGYLANDIHRILWTACKREKIRISMVDWKIFRLVKVSKW